MDASLDLLVPQIVPIAGLESATASFTWGGVSYPQEPTIYRWGEFVELVETPIPPQVLSYLPESYLGLEWVTLSVRGQGLDLLQQEANGLEVDWKERSLEELLHLILTQCGKWVVAFQPQSDQIDAQYRLTAEECIEHLRSNLSINIVPEGFVAIPPDEA